MSREDAILDAMQMEVREQKERDFQNRALREGIRDKVDKFYLITHSSRVFYENFLASNCKSKNTLEYGCGPGSKAGLLSRNGATVTGIDISDTAIEQAREMVTRKHLDKTTFRLMNAEALEFEDNIFDLICGTGILHHLSLDKAFSELARTLKAGGTAIFTEPLGHNPLINLYRKLTPELRTEDEHPLLMRDLKMIEAYFGKVEIHFFHLHSLMAVPFRKSHGFSRLLSALDALDKLTFKLLPLTRKYAWQAVIVASQPKKARFT